MKKTSAAKHLKFHSRKRERGEEPKKNVQRKVEVEEAGEGGEGGSRTTSTKCVA